MKGSILWKLIVTVLALCWAVFSLLPLKDQDFATYLRDQATAKPEELGKLIDEAKARVDAKQTRSVLTGLRDIGKERRIDFSQYYTHLQMDASLKNVEKRNQLLLGELSKRSKASLQLGLDLRGGVSFTLEVDESARATTAGGRPAEVAEARQQQLQKAIEIIGARINQLGVSEPVIRPVGDNRIQVQLAGVNTKDDPDVINVLKKPARLDFRLVHASQRPTGAAGEEAPIGYEVMNMESEDDQGRTVLVPYFVKRIPEMTGETVDSAYVQTDSIGRFMIGLRFNSKGADQFAKVTEQNVNRSLGIVLDGRLYSAPNINEPIRGGSAQISGHFSQREAFELANVLNNPLDVPLRVAEMNEVGPSLAQDSIQSGAKAVVIGAIGVALFMVAVYLFLGGTVALIALAINVVLILGCLASIGATLTLPGIAGIVLTMGMAVDANILIYERIREELNAGKSLKAALAAGYDRAFTTIVDANLTTLITSATMIVLGNGAVKGFGITVTIGIFTTLFASLVLSKVLLQWLVNYDIVKSFKMTPTFQGTKIDFMRYGKPAFIASWAIIVIGMGYTAVNWKQAQGIDFAGGDEVTFTFTQRLAEHEVRDFGLKTLGYSEANPVYQSQLGSSSETLTVQVPAAKGTEFSTKLTEAFPKAGLKETGITSVGPSLGREILLNAVLAIAIGVVGIMLYVAFRFEMGFGLGAVVSTLHDVFMVIGIYVMCGYQLNSSLVAAVLLIVGYSINDTVVVFDRIREELILNPGMKLREVINLSVNVTLARTTLTSLSTFFASLALYIFGSGAIEDLAFAFLIGIITGTFSSVFVASPIFAWYHKGEREKLDLAIVEEKPRYDWETGAKEAR